MNMSSIGQLTYFSHLYLLAILGTGDDTHGSNPQSCSACPRLADWVSSLDEVLSVRLQHGKPDHGP